MRTQIEMETGLAGRRIHGQPEPLNFTMKNPLPLDGKAV
jgi:hypothetical protein